MTAPLTPGRRALLTFGVPLSLAFIGYGALGILNAVGLTHYTQSVDLVPTAHVLNVDTGDGDVHLVPSPDGNVHVLAEGVYTLSKPRLSTASTTAGVTVTGRQCNGGILICSEDMTIAVPAGFQITARTSGGDVSATNVQSTEVSASSSAGDVRLAFSVPPTRVLASSSAGDVTIRVPTSVAYKVSGSTSGGGTRDILLTPDDTSARSITADSGSGDVLVEGSG
ncbi:MAG: hypothetical protein QOJ83_1737 [Frankiales bacterium]|nr:hypothetical protein [Frankiales bacterium]